MLSIQGGLGSVLALLAPAATPVPIFREVPPVESGISWIHTNGKSPQHYLPETMGAGVAIFDYDNDGWMDILLVDSGSSSFYTPRTPLHPVLYRNNHDATYADVSHQAGLTADLFGQGVAVADYEGDGFKDIFITGIGKCVLYLNIGNGTFAFRSPRCAASPSSRATTTWASPQVE
jgi:hypothetical protein